MLSDFWNPRLRNLFFCVYHFAWLPTLTPTLDSWSSSSWVIFVAVEVGVTCGVFFSGLEHFDFPQVDCIFSSLLLPIHERLFTPQCLDKSLKQKHRFGWFRLQVGETQVNTLGIAPVMVLLFSFLGGPWFVISPSKNKRALRALGLPNKPTTYTQRTNCSWLGYFMVFLKNMHFMDVIWCHLMSPSDSRIEESHRDLKWVRRLSQNIGKRPL